MRSLTLAALVLFSFSLAPAAFANGYQALGTPCVQGTNACQSGVCGASGLNPENMCLPCTATSCGAGATCESSGVCLANPVTPPPPAVSTAPKANGASCFSSSECVSGFCQGDPTGGGTCQPQPAANPSPGGNPSAQPAQPVTLINPLKGVDCTGGTGNCLLAFLNNILSFVIEIGTIIVILMLVFVGYKFVAAQGSDSKITEARTMLLWTVIGALVLLGAKAISLGILSTVQALGG